MDINEKMKLIELLSEMEGLMIVNKIERKDNRDFLSKAKKVAERLSSEGIGKFDFSSDEKFEESLSNFLKVQ